MRHLLVEHVPVVNALDTYFGEFGGTLGVMPFFVNAHSSCQGALCEVLTTTINQRASILQGLDRPIENALGVVKICL